MSLLTKYRIEKILPGICSIRPNCRPTEAKVLIVDQLNILGLISIDKLYKAYSQT